jgi:alpha-2-macroglobulin
MRSRCRLHFPLIVAMATVVSVLGASTFAGAEGRDAARPAFSLASSAIFTTRESPAIYLTFQQVERLDFRIYKVRDPMAFVAGLKDPHQLGSETPLVDQEPTTLERVASWKATWRWRLRNFVRSQFSHGYRQARHRQQDQQRVVLRRTEQVHTFAQVPLLNPSQLVTSWREILPPMPDPEVRRIPLELTAPGMYVVEAVSAPHRAYTVVIVSDVGLVSKAAPGQVLLYAADRKTGTPVPGCDVRVIANHQSLASGTTGTDGVFAAMLEQTAADDVVSVATCGGQVTASDPGSWYLRESPRELVGYVFTDKPIYRPGHTVHIKTLLRWRTRGALVPFDAPEVEVRVSDVTDKVVYRQRRKVDAFGGVSSDVPLGAGVALGDYAIAVLHGDDTASGSFEVQEYRKPEFEVRVSPAERFVVQGGAIAATVNARYYFGQPVANAKIAYAAHKQPYYSPLRWSEDEEDGGGYWYGDDQVVEGEARLDANGNATIQVPADVDDGGRDYSLRIEARVTDASNREVTGNALAHATVGTFLIAASIDTYVARPGGTVTMSLRAVSYTGVPQASTRVRVAVLARSPNARWDDEGGTREVTTAMVTTDTEGRASWTVPVPRVAGDYRVRASAQSGGRTIADDSYLWVPGPQERTDEDYGYDKYLELIAEKKTALPGETTRFLIRGAEFDSQVLVTKEAHGVSWHRVVRARGNETIEVPITADDVGDTWVNIAFLKDDRLYRAERRVKVPAVSRQLAVTLTAEAAVSKPRTPGRFAIKAVDAEGNPVRAQFALGVIDEAVYGVKADTTADPLRFFYQRNYSRVGTTFSREYAFVGYSGTQQLMLAMRKRPYSLADFKADAPAQPQVRKEFPDAIYWVADVVTNARGEASVQITYPDALTTWRLTARGTTVDTRVGQAIARTTVTKDLIVRVITPRFLTEGDDVVTPVVAHNYLPEERAIDLTLTATGLTAAGAPASPRISVASGGEARLDWRFRAGPAGRATVTGTATTTGDRDAVELSFPVLPFGLKRNVGKSGSLAVDGTASATLAIPAHSNPSARTITVGLAPSLAGSMLGALDFLTGYPYGCTEQTLSSFLPNLVVARALAQLKLTPTERLSLLDRQVTAGLTRLLDYQHDDGGWGWWKTDENHPFMTAYAIYGLLEAKANGYQVDAAKIRQGLGALVRLYREYPRAVPALKAYMIFVISRARAAGLVPDAGEGANFDHAAALNETWARRGDLTPYGRALLLLTLDAEKDQRGNELANTLLAEVRQTGDLAWWEVDYDPLLEDWADTSVEATATALQALTARNPTNPLLEAAVRYLLANRQSGAYWASTKQTAMALYGLTAFMKARGEQPSAFAVDVSVNGAPARTVAFDAAALTAPDPVLISAPGREGDNAVTLIKRGGGALYWSATATYFDTRTPIERTGGRRLAISREYFALASHRAANTIVYRETPFAGTAAPGDVILVRLTVAGAEDWRYLLIEDPLPAGAETIADDSLYPLERRRTRPWGGRQEFRDDRAVFFQDGLPDGRVEFWYLVKIVTPGTFRAMPAQVTPMYVPGVSASTTAMTVTVTSPGTGASQ